MKHHAPAAQRNRDPILDVLRRVLPDTGRVLEIASGSGEHAVYFAQGLPKIVWQPSDLDPRALASIRAWRDEAGLPNLRGPIALDVASEEWSAPPADAIVCINMIHIAPWQACEGLIRGSARLLPPGGLLYLYGPFRFEGRFTAPSNESFDASLRARDPSWGVRDVTEITSLANSCGLVPGEVIAMPANNHSVVFRRGA